MLVRRRSRCPPGFSRGRKAVGERSIDHSTSGRGATSAVGCRNLNGHRQFDVNVGLLLSYACVSGPVIEGTDQRAAT